jgi:hypothetical protein
VRRRRHKSAHPVTQSIYAITQQTLRPPGRLFLRLR